jgi:hypothetical protein
VLISEVGPRDGLHGMTPDAGLPKGFVYADGRSPFNEGLLAAKSGAPA